MLRLVFVLVTHGEKTADRIAGRRALLYDEFVRRAQEMRQALGGSGTFVGLESFAWATCAPARL